MMEYLSKIIKKYSKIIIPTLFCMVMILSGVLNTSKGKGGETKLLAGLGTTPFTSSYDLSGTDSDMINKEDSHIYINGKAIETGEEVKNNDKVEVRLAWKIRNKITLTTEDTLTYTLPSNITFDDANGDVVDSNGHPVGIYTIKDNIVTIKYTSEEFLSGNNIIGHLIIDGTITEDKTGSGGEGDKNLIFEGIGKFNVKYVKTTGLTISKTVEKLSTGRYKYSVTVTSIKENSNVEITDTMGKYIHLDQDTVKFELNGKDVTKEYANDESPTKIDKDGSLDRISKSVTKMNDNDVIILTYEADIDDKAYLKNYTDSHTLTANLENKAETKSDELKDWISSEAVVITDIDQSSIEKSGKYNATEKTVTWTVIVKPGEKGVNLKEELGDYQTPTGDIEVFESNDSGKTYSNSTYGAQSLYDDINKNKTLLFGEEGYKIVFDKTGEKVYKFVFDVDVSKTGLAYGKLYNKARIIIGEDSKSTGNQSVGTVGTRLLDKEFVSADVENSTIEWKSTITSYDEQLNELIYTDTLGEGLSLVENSVKVSINGSEYKTVEYTLVDSEFKINFGNVESNTKIYITYKTYFDKTKLTDGDYTYENTGKVKTNGIEVSDKEEYVYEKEENYISKSYDSKNDSKGSNISTEGTAYWHIDINTLPSYAENITITDIVPDGMEYVEGSAYLLDKHGDKTTIDDPTVKDGKYVFDISEYADDLKKNSGISLWLQTKIKDFKAENQKYTNNAYITINGEDCPKVNASVEGAVTTLVSKDGDYNYELGSHVTYTIVVNEGAYELNNGKAITLNDEMGSALNFDYGSLKVDGELWENKDGNNNYTYDTDSKILTINNLPDSKKLTITYTATISGVVGTKLTEENAYNKVKLLGNNSSDSTSEKTFIGEVKDSRAGSSNDSATINIHKQDEENNAMEGVEFKLYDVEYSSCNKEKCVLTGKETPVDTLTTNSNGNATNTKLVYDHIYKLVETSTNNDYIMDKTEYYFVFEGNDETEYPNAIKNSNLVIKDSTENFIQYSIVNKIKYTNLEVNKIWEDNNSNTRPESITVHLKQNGKDYKETVLTKDNWKATFENLPKYDEDGNKYEYTVEEDSVYNYKASYNSSETYNKKTITITNTQNGSNLTIHKDVAGVGADEKAQFHFTLTLKDKNGEELTDEFDCEECTNGKIKSGESITLRHSQSAIIKNIPIGTQYEVTEQEADQNGYTTEAENDKGTITNDQITAKFTNTNDTIPTGNLKITKTVAGDGNTSKDFTFTVNLKDKDNKTLTDEFEYSGSKSGKIKSGQTVTLKHGEYIIIEDIPENTVYEVTEAKATEGNYEYTTASVGNKGTVVKNETSTAAFTNSLTIPKGSLTISKSVTGIGNTDKDFTFIITLKDQNDNVLTEEFEYSGSKSGKIKSGDTITLKHNQKITINNIPENTKYEVTEQEANQGGYITSNTGDKNGTIKEGTQTVAFTNYLPGKGSLNISKTVTNDGDKNKDFTFTITLKDKVGNDIIGTYKYTKSDNTEGQISSGSSITLKDGQNLTIEGIPENTEYEVTEQEASLGKYTYKTTSNGEKGEITKDKTSSANFTNDLVIPKGNLTISKTVTGDGNKDTYFTFTVNLKDSNNNTLNGTYNYSGSKTGKVKSGGTITLKDGESITIENIPEDTIYEVTEAKATEGNYEYTISSVGDKGTIDKNETSIATYTNNLTIPKGSLTISKIVSGNAGDIQKDFTFKITLTNEDGSLYTKDVNYTGSKEGKIKSGETITLKHGESVTLNNIDENTNYEVEEVEANQDGYVTTSENEKGSITKNTLITTTFTNTKKDGFITINKTVTGDGDKTKGFSFRVTLKDKDGKELEDEFEYSGSKSGKIKSGDIFTLKHGENITITHLPDKTQYEVTELDATGYTVTSKNEKGTVSEEGVLVSFTNHLEKTIYIPKTNILDNESLYIPKTGVSDNESLYTAGLILSTLGIILLKKKHA